MLAAVLAADLARASRKFVARMFKRARRNIKVDTQRWSWPAFDSSLSAMYLTIQRSESKRALFSGAIFSNDHAATITVIIRMKRALGTSLTIAGILERGVGMGARRRWVIAAASFESCSLPGTCPVMLISLQCTQYIRLRSRTSHLGERPSHRLCHQRARIRRDDRCKHFHECLESSMEEHVSQEILDHVKKKRWMVTITRLSLTNAAIFAFDTGRLAEALKIVKQFVVALGLILYYTLSVSVMNVSSPVCDP